MTHDPKTTPDHAARRAAWGHVARHDEQLWRLRLNNSRGHLQVNTYVYRDEDALVVIDPGWPWTLDALEAALRELGLGAGLGAVTAWLYTHSHVDHMGAAALLERVSRAPHLASRGLTPQLGRWHDFQDELSDWSGWVRARFVEPWRGTLLAQIERDAGQGSRMIMSREHGPGVISRFEPLDWGQRLALGGLSLQVLDARGHDPHHAAFWAPERGWLWCGDVVLPVPTPLSPPMGDDLTLYEQTLDRLEAMPSALLWPGHGPPIQASRAADALARSRSFLRELEAAIVQALDDEDGPMDLYTLALHTWPERASPHPPSRWWVHMARVDTHLMALLAKGQLVCTTAPGQGPRYWR